MTIMDLINEPALKDLIKQIVGSKIDDEVQKRIEGRTINIDEFRKQYCGGKGREWVRVFIFDAFPETDVANGGWAVNPHNGYRTIIFQKRAAEWMQQNQLKIDWNASLIRMRASKKGDARND